jgi:hypothetical protein
LPRNIVELRGSYRWSAAGEARAIKKSASEAKITAEFAVPDGLGGDVLYFGFQQAIDRFCQRSTRTSIGDMNHRFVRNHAPGGFADWNVTMGAHVPGRRRRVPSAKRPSKGRRLPNGAVALARSEPVSPALHPARGEPGDLCFLTGSGRTVSRMVFSAVALRLCASIGSLPPSGTTLLVLPRGFGMPHRIALMGEPRRQDGETAKPIRPND